MDLTGKRVLITGGAGLVGSHLAAHLLADNDIVVADDLSKGSRDRVPVDAEFVKADMTDPDDVAAALTADVDVVFHFAAYTDTNFANPRQLFEENGAMTYNVLERMSDVGVEHLAFTSSSTVYGEAPMPTPEEFGPMEPISLYGAAKLSEEALVSTFAHSYGVTAWVYRFANIVGPHQRGNVIPDFIEKLLADPDELEILGDGRQEKSYLHVDDCVKAMCHVIEHTDDAFNLYNLGTETTTSVTTIADIVADTMGLDPEYRFTGGDRGWTGDVPKMRLDVSRLLDLGWEPALGSNDAVRRATRELYAELT